MPRLDTWRPVLPPDRAVSRGACQAGCSTLAPRPLYISERILHVVPDDHRQCRSAAAAATTSCSATCGASFTMAMRLIAAAGEALARFRGWRRHRRAGVQCALSRRPRCRRSSTTRACGGMPGTRSCRRATSPFATSPRWDMRAFTASDPSRGTGRCSSACRAARTDLADADAIVCSGLVHDRTETAEDYRGVLEAALKRKLPFVCANPDLAVDVGPDRLPCAGAIAALYEEMGGPVFWAGKPHASAYQAAMLKAEELAGRGRRAGPGARDRRCRSAPILQRRRARAWMRCSLQRACIGTTRCRTTT